MNKTKSYILGLAAVMACASAFTACQDDFDEYKAKAPVAEKKANMTILDLKEKFWNEATNYIDTIGVENGVADDKDYIISGRVCSSDQSGNIFKNFVIQDESAAITISVNSYNLYLTYRLGQEVVIDLKGMYIGKYNGLVQLGYPEYYEAGSAWEASFMSPEFFNRHVELNGYPEPEKVDTIVLNDFSALGSNPEQLWKYQSQLIRINNVYFQEGGKAQFSEYHSSGVERTLTDANGQSVIVRTSGYSNFWNQYLPEGKGDVVCIAGYYGTKGWQLTLIDAEGCMNFGNPTLGPGAETNPYTVDDAIAAINGGAEPTGWVEGYIVGSLMPLVENVTSNDEVIWGKDAIMDITLVIGQTPETKDIEHALVLPLGEGTALREYGNLLNNPDNYGKKIMVRGTMGSQYGTYGVSCSGKAADFKIEGVVIDNSVKDGNGTAASPYSAKQAYEMCQNNTYTSDKVYVTGYVTGVQVTSFDPNYGSLIYYISNDGTETNQFEIYRGYSFKGAKFPSADALKEGDLVVVYGALTNYYGTLEMTTGGQLVTVNGKTEFDSDGGSQGGGEVTGAGSKDEPFSVAAVRGGAIGNGVWVKGYIVGFAEGNNIQSGAKFTAEGASESNILIADNASEKNVANCIPVQLVASTAARAALNLKNNPGNLGKEVMVQGNLAKYFGTVGVRSTTGYEIDGNEGGTIEIPTDGKGEGTEANPYDVNKALEIILTGKSPETEVYVAGKVVSVQASSFNPDYCQLTYFISNDGTATHQLEVYRGYALNGDKFESAEALKPGDDVVVCGIITFYQNVTPEFTTGSKLVKWSISEGGSTGGDEQGGDEQGGDEPEQPGDDTGAGSEANPFSVADVIGGAIGNGVWVKGYIVGYVKGLNISGATFSAEGAVATNLLIAASASETDVANCIPVQLVKNTEVQAAVSLQVHPENLGKEVLIQGDLQTFFQVPGLKGPTAYKFVE